ncbi:MAG: DUF885 domain-containing protein [Oscillospiraceae bacterium]|nr:DUF885 domain-containing protein [Oscillospiraceae bacterium]
MGKITKKTNFTALICAALVLAVVFTSGYGCLTYSIDFGFDQPTTNIQMEFDEFTKQLLPSGERAVTWTRYYECPTQKEVDETLEFKESFAAYFSRDLLTGDQQVVYDMIIYNLDSFLDSVEVFYYDEPLTASDGDHIGVALTLMNASLTDEDDVKVYISLLKDIPGYFDHLMEYEREKANQGIFMLDSNLEAVQEELINFARFVENNKGYTYHPLSLLFALELDGIEDLTDGEKGGYFELANNIVNDEVLPAYENLSGELGELKGSREYADGSLADMPKGREYIANVLRYMGITDSPDDMIKNLQNLFVKTLGEYFDYDSYPGGSNPAFDSESGQDALDYLQKYAAGDFPPLPDGVTCTVEAVDPSLEDSARPAMYYIPKLDNITDNKIVVNEKYIRADKTYFFSIFAHEGYPGHMLHFTTIFSQEMNTLRKLWGYLANIEGWATYAELYAYKYFPGDRGDNHNAMLKYTLDLTVGTLMEMGINYEGWGERDTKEFLESIYDRKFTASEITEIRDGIISNPFATAPYGLGYQQLTELRGEFPHMTDLEFHTAYMKTGSVPFPLMRDYLAKKSGGLGLGIASFRAA